MATNTAKQVEIKLNEAEAKIVGLLPEGSRQAATDSLLTAKRESMAKVIKNRTEFSVQVNDSGNIVVRGLNNRFPLGMRPDSARILFSPENVAKVTALLATLPTDSK